MKINDTQHEMIDAYVQQQLKGEALKSFEHELIANEAIKQEVLFRQGIRSAFQVKAVERVIQQAKSDPLLEEANERKIEHPQLESVHNTIQQAKAENDIRKRRTIRRLVAVGIAASVLGLFFIGGILGEPSLPELADDNFSIPKVELTYTVPKIEPVSAIRDDIQNRLSAAMQAYKTNNFSQTRSIFEELRSQYDYETDEILLYEANMDYDDENYDNSIDILEQIIARNSKIKDEAHWYLALTYLKMEQKDPAKQQLEIVANQASTYQEKAQKLLKKVL